MFFFSKIRAEVEEAIGVCDDAIVFRTVTRAIEALANTGLFDPQIAYLDFQIGTGMTIALPRDVKTPLKVNINNNPSFHRSRLFEFGQNTEGSVTGEEIGWTWGHRGYVCVQDETYLPSTLKYVCASAGDSGQTCEIHGLDGDGREITDTIEASPTYGAATATQNTYAKITKIIRQLTSGECQLRDDADETLARYYPDELRPEYRAIKLSKPSTSIRLMYRKHVFEITSDDDIIPVDSPMAVIQMAMAIRLLQQKEWDAAAKAKAVAIELLKDEQASRDEGGSMAEATEIANIINESIHSRDGVLVAEVYDDASAIFGPIGRDNIFDKITTATEALANATTWDSTIGICDIQRAENSDVNYLGTKPGSGLFVLPRFVEAPISVNWKSAVGYPRNRWFEFHLNGHGFERNASDPGTWDDLGETCITGSIKIDDDTKLIIPSKVVAVPASATDNNCEIVIYGIEMLNGVEVEVYRNGSPGWTVPCVYGSVAPGSGAPLFTRIDRITKAESTGFIKLHTLDGAATDVLIGNWYPDETEPKYRMIRVPNATAGRIRIRYRRRFKKFTSLYEPIPLRSRNAIVSMLRAIKQQEADPQGAIAHETNAIRYLRDEQAATNPHSAPFLQFDESVGYGVNENVT